MIQIFRYGFQWLVQIIIEIISLPLWGALHSFVCQCVLKQHNRAEKVWSLVLQDLSSCYNTATYYPVIHSKGMTLSDPQLLESSKVLKIC